MEAKVIKQFRDKYSKKIYNASQKIEITKERLEEINSTSLGIFVEEIKERKIINKNKTTDKVGG